MSSLRLRSLPTMLEEKPSRGKCMTTICFSWKVITCIVSHVTLVLLVVSYCVGGAYLFQRLEKPHELQIKTEIQHLRQNLTDKIWKFSDNSTVLSEIEWIKGVNSDLANFENQILTSMKKDGWDGEEDSTKSQWTFAGSLFYSIIVITTIGYGHISPRTDWGKITTIFYAIIGIPLMLLCLSNIGDMMATSFRFIYWRICCFICTRSSKLPPNHFRQRSIRGSHNLPRSQHSSLKHSMKLSHRLQNGSVMLKHSHSDPEICTAGSSCRNRVHRTSGNSRRQPHTSERKLKNSGTLLHRYCYEDNVNYNVTPDRGGPRNTRQRSHPHCRILEQEGKSFNRFQNPHHHAVTLGSKDELDSWEIHNLHLQSRGRSVPNIQRERSKSVDRRTYAHLNFDEESVNKTPIISNRYAIYELQHYNHWKKRLRSQSMPRTVCRKNFINCIEPSNTHQQQSSLGNRVGKADVYSPYTKNRSSRYPTHCKERRVEQSNNHASQFPRKTLENLQEKTDHLSPSLGTPPVSFAIEGQARCYSTYNNHYDMVNSNELWEKYKEISPKDRPVPIWLCVFLVISYILGGAALFAYWEAWSFLDSAYFCFITLTTIGFGDFVPAKGVKDESEQSIAYCSLYLLFGIALLAMSFNLVQEEFICSVKNVARRLGILIDEEDQD